MTPGQRFFVPEVVQTSAMDCGPATLKCLLEGFGIPVSYGRLREACQTDVDGTSIDTMAELAVALGLEAEQEMIPADHLLLPEAKALPAIVVVRQPSGLTHFVVVWAYRGGLVQVMDPAVGRRWVRPERLLDELYVHEMRVPASAFREWVGSDSFLHPLGKRLADLGVPGGGRAQIDAALADPGWRSMAALDAAARIVAVIVRAGAVARGEGAAGALDALVNEAKTAGDVIPGMHWSARPAPPGDDGEEQVLLRGSVLVRVAGRRAAGAPAGELPLSPELTRALAEPPARPARELWRMLRADGLFAPSSLAVGLGLATAGVVVEALLFRGVLAMGRELGLVQQRAGAAGMLLLFLLALLGLEAPLAAGTLRIGRHLEARLRVGFLEKVPELGDRYLQSRPTSDMAERSHVLHVLRELAVVSGMTVRAVMSLGVTTAALAWIHPAGAPVALAVAALTVILPFAAQGVLGERDLRARNHAGSLGRFYLDALLGLVAIHAHGAERAVRREHEGLLVEWARASLGVQRAVVAVEGAQTALGVGLAGWLFLDFLARAGPSPRLLLLLYWALSLPVLAQQLMLALRQYPTQRNVLLRLLEPLGASPEAEGGAAPASTSPSEPASTAGVALAFHGVSVRAGGHAILEGVELTVPAGCHVAVVGPSGAGKSTLVGLLLGWHRPSAGTLLVDGAPADGARIEALRAETAWVDPAVQLWNGSLLDNLRYGAPSLPEALGGVIEQADLRGVLARLPDGLQTSLGEGGGLVSGGEGQRVRLGRALLRGGARLAILDEPFRGLDRAHRRALLGRVRGAFRGATLLCITHDVEETLDFERVVVIDGGALVEEGPPAELRDRPGSRYGALLRAEADARRELWSGAGLRRMHLERGQLVERGDAEP